MSYLADAVPLPEIGRALVTKLRHHGDVLLASPVFAALARAAPHLEIDALVDRAPLHDRPRRQASGRARAGRSRAATGGRLARATLRLADPPDRASARPLARPSLAAALRRDPRARRRRTALATALHALLSPA